MADGGKEKSFDVRDPDFEQRVRGSFARQGLMSTLGAVMTHVSPGCVDVEMPFDEALSQQHGFFHAGGIGSIADTAGGYAAATLYGPEDGVLTVEFKLNLIAPADGDMLVARGQVVRPGRTLTVATGEVLVRKDGVLRPCALMQQTLMRIVGRNGIIG
tara:strand:- start:15263 stop:15736 length:474 start_codon:yes stop_codon:yes gene_type:complete